MRKAAEADAAARRAGRSAVFREGDIANHRDGDSDDDTDDERERALEDQGVFLELEGGSDSDDDATAAAKINAAVVVAAHAVVVAALLPPAAVLARGVPLVAARAPGPGLESQVTRKARSCQ